MKGIVMLPDGVPDGYYYADYYVSGSNVNQVHLLACFKCGSLVVNHHTHTAWHKNNDKNLVYDTTVEYRATFTPVLKEEIDRYH